MADALKEHLDSNTTVVACAARVKSAPAVKVDRKSDTEFVSFPPAYMHPETSGAVMRIRRGASIMQHIKKGQKMKKFLKRWVSFSLIFSLIMIVSLLPANIALAKKKWVRVYKISGNIMTYRTEKWITEEECIAGKKKRIKLSRNVKFYWFRGDDVGKYDRISKKKFLKRLKYMYDPFNNDFVRDWDSGKLRKNGRQGCRMTVSKGKVMRLWGEYEP